MSEQQPCQAGQRCRAYDRQADRPALTGAPLCEACLADAERAVTALDDDVAALLDGDGPSASTWSSRSGARPVPGPKLPMPAHRFDAAAAIVWVLTAWEPAVRERAGLSDVPSGRVRMLPAARRAVNVLAPRLDILAGIAEEVLWDYPLAGDDEATIVALIAGEPQRAAVVTGWRGVLDLAALHRRAQQVLGLTSAMPERCEGVPCRSCEAQALYRVPGEDTVRCGMCGDRYDAEGYHRWVGLLAAAVTRKDTDQPAA